MAPGTTFQVIVTLPGPATATETSLEGSPCVQTLLSVKVSEVAAVTRYLYVAVASPEFAPLASALTF